MHTHPLLSLFLSEITWNEHARFLQKYPHLRSFWRQKKLFLSSFDYSPLAIWKCWFSRVPMSPAGQGKATWVEQPLSTQNLQQCVQAGEALTLWPSPRVRFCLSIKSLCSGPGGDIYAFVVLWIVLMLLWYRVTALDKLFLKLTCAASLCWMLLSTWTVSRMCLKKATSWWRDSC